ncbi:hypothetical protein F5984_19835 [Rudanella paleaurantiibacter]|uniref:Uncharacterized protein n=1 Tax=Rudanella paleaurantiibacter TaxID=2614655 RepID=A0A7J5TV29_9BACT|nr:hypothetical protein [Rudanella paleaurantiibacter]KAB7728008.1 hypothetical protein F5984_19835 [Rudanella paleaurantiibacter]
MENPIQIAISPEPFTGFKRAARLENFVVMKDLNMVQQVCISYVNEAGVPMLELIAADATIGAEQRGALQDRYRDRIVTRETRDAYIIPATGQIVPKGTEGAISQVDYFQAITIGQLRQRMVIDDNTPFAQILYALLASEIATMDARGQL